MAISLLARLRQWVIKYVRLPSIWDRDFHAKFTGLADQRLQAPRVKVILRRLYDLSPNTNPATLGILTEAFNRLIDRCAAVLKTEWELYHWEKLREKRPLRDIQNDFINHHQAFLEQTYNFCGALMSIVGHAPHDFRRGIPTRSATTFINKLMPGSRLSEAIAFRGRYVVHTYAAAPFGWWTSSGWDGRAHVFLQEEGKNEIDVAEILKIPNGTSGFMTATAVAPHHLEVADDLINLVDLFGNRLPHVD